MADHRNTYTFFPIVHILHGEKGEIHHFEFHHYLNSFAEQRVRQAMVWESWDSRQPAGTQPSDNGQVELLGKKKLHLCLQKRYLSPSFQTPITLFGQWSTSAILHHLGLSPVNQTINKYSLLCLPMCLYPTKIIFQTGFRSSQGWQERVEGAGDLERRRHVGKNLLNFSLIQSIPDSNISQVRV